METTLYITKGKMRHPFQAKLKITPERILFDRIPYSKILNEEIKSMKGYRWHGFDDPPVKKWSVENCQRNVLSLRSLMGENIYEWFERPLRDDLVEFDRPLKPQQVDMVRRGLTYHYQILAAEQGCISGDAIVHINRASRGFSISLRELCYKFHGGLTNGKKWDKSITTQIRAFRGNFALEFNDIKDVLFQGVKPVIKIVTQSGKELVCTPDHEICTGDLKFGYFTRADKLAPGDQIMIQAAGNYPHVEQKPPNTLIKYASSGVGGYLDSDGYIRIGGLKGHPRAAAGRCFVYEHLLVMEELLGRPIKRSEQVHHKNGQRWDNRPENLQLCENRKAHAQKHKLCSVNCGNAVYTWDTVVSIIPYGETDVYDIVCDGPYHNFVANDIVVHNCGKTLAAIEIIERSGHKDCWYVGPKSGLASVELEIKKWGLNANVNLMTYNKLVSIVELESNTVEIPGLVIFDESDGLKTPTTHRAIAAQWVADKIREKYGYDGYVILLSGTPSAKHPGDLWSQCEITWPGYLREGSFAAFEQRYAIVEEGETPDGVTYTRRNGWKKDEVAKLPNRYKGLMTVYRKADWLTLPPKKYRTVKLTPTNKVLRVAKSLTNVAPNVITALTWLRALSSGFQYVNTQVGEEQCPVCSGSGKYDYPEPHTCPGCNGLGKKPKYERKAKFVFTPKDSALKEELDKCETHGRIVVAASFQGSIDRVLAICKERGWSVACVDGRGWRSYDSMGNSIDIKPLDLWSEHHGKVAFVGNPGSCRYGLTLTLAHTLVFYDNSFSAVERLQFEDRIHRMTMNELLGATIVDLVHLPVDQLVIDVLKSNKELELLSLGAIKECIGIDSEVTDEEILD